MDPDQADFYRYGRAAAMPGHDGVIIYPALGAGLGQQLVKLSGVGIEFPKMVADNILGLQAINVLANGVGEADDPSGIGNADAAQAHIHQGLQEDLGIARPSRG